MNINIDTGSLVSTAAGQPVIIKTNGNPFDVTVRFQKPHDGITKIALKNAQIPVGFYNIREPYNTITIDSTTYTIPAGSYDISWLLSVLNTTTSGVGTWSITVLTNLIQFVTSTVDDVTLTVPTNLNYPTLANLLGFTQTVSGQTLTAPNTYMINLDTYINIYIDNLGRPSIDPSKSTFKIPNTGGSVIQWAENNQDDQSIQVRDNSSVDRLIVAVYDRFGFLLNNNGLDWSFTLRITSTN